MNSLKPKTCHNGHPIENVPGTNIFLQDCVIRCNRCGNVTISESLEVTHLRDFITPDDTLIHVYHWRFPSLCKSCGNMLSDTAIQCLPIEFALSNYEEQKRRGAMPIGYTPN